MSNEIATTTPSSINVIPSPGEWSTIHSMAKALLPTGFLPNSIKTPEQAVAIMLKGRELNVPPMYALSNIVIVQGKPTVSAEMMLALVQRDYGLEAMWVEESTNDYCKVGYRSGGGTKFYTFSMEDAKRAGVTKNQVWGQYPAAMCRARAISAVARMAFPGAIGGVYVSGELGDEVEVDPETQNVTSKATATIDNSTGEIVDTPQASEEPKYTPEEHREIALTHFDKLIGKIGVTKEELEAFIRKGGDQSGTTDNMSVDQIRQAYRFIKNMGDKAKEYFENTLAEQQELEEIQMEVM